MTLLSLLALICIIWIIASLPQWKWHNSGYGPPSMGAILLVLVLVWILFGGGLRH